MYRRNKFTRIMVVILIVGVLLCVCLMGCEEIKSFIGNVKGELVGREFAITQYDHYGNPTLKLSGTKVHIGVLENSANFSAKSPGFESEVLEITINGKEMYHIGSTAIFAEEGLDMITDFEIDEEIKASSGGGFMFYDRIVNDYANKIGKKKTVIISSQLGIPIGVYQGDSVYVEVPENLPKMTLLSIDGKALYISRATYTIIDSELIE